MDQLMIPTARFVFSLDASGLVKLQVWATMMHHTQRESV